MALQQVLNSTAKHALYVFRNNRGALASVKPAATEKGLRSVKSFAQALDMSKAAVTKGGKFTEYGREQLAELLKRMDLPATANWQDVANRVIANTQAINLKPLQPITKEFVKSKNIPITTTQEIQKMITDSFKKINIIA